MSDNSTSTSALYAVKSVDESFKMNIGSRNDKEDKRIIRKKEDSKPDNNVDTAVLVIILQCESKPCDNNIANLKKIFSDSFFTVQVCSVDIPSEIVNNNSLTRDQYLENYRMRKALTYAAEGPYLTTSDGAIKPQFLWNKLPCIIVKDSSISNISFESGGMRRRIETALDKASQADLFYLCKWNDACDKYKDITPSIDNGSSLKWSTQPTATQAIMYTEKSRDKIRETLQSANTPLSSLLNNLIADGKMMATVFVPNIIDFDIELSTSNADYLKLNECAPAPTTTEQTNNTAWIIWFIILVILMLIVAYIIIRVNPQRR